MFDVARAGRGGDEGMGDMGGLEGTGEELGAEESEVVLDGENLGFSVKMVNGTHLHAACGNSEGGVLDALEFLYV